MAELPQRLHPVIDAFGSDMAGAMAQAYVREFSAGELREIRKFAQSPAGSHYLSASMKMLEDPAIAAANDRFLKTLPASIDQIMADWDRQTRAYRAKKRADSGVPTIPTTMTSSPRGEPDAVPMNAPLPKR
jgi:hypothetical protein